MILLFLFYIVLDPRLKLNYFKKQQWEQKFIDQAKTIFINTYNHDYANKTNIISNNYENNNNDNDFLYEIFGSKNINYDNEFQVEEYLNKPIEGPKTDPLRWWKVNFILDFK